MRDASEFAVSDDTQTSKEAMKTDNEANRTSLPATHKREAANQTQAMTAKGQRTPPRNPSRRSPTTPRKYQVTEKAEPKIASHGRLRMPGSINGRKMPAIAANAAHAKPTTTRDGFMI